MFEMSMFDFKKLLSLLILPPFSAFFLIALGLILIACHFKKIGFTCAWGGLLLACIFSQPLSVGWFARPSDTAPVLNFSTVSSDKAQAIVVLGGGLRRYAPEFGGETLSAASLERVRYAAKLAKKSRLPVLTTGAGSQGNESEALYRQKVLETEFGVPVRWQEHQARDTRENAMFSAKILKAEGIEKVYLVTHAVHMKRARRVFEQAGLKVIPAPTGWIYARGKEGQLKPAAQYLPTGYGAYTGWQVLHEWLGNAAYWLDE